MAAISYPTPEPLRRRSGSGLSGVPGIPARQAPRQRHLRLIQGGSATSARPAPGVYSRRRLGALAMVAVVVMLAVVAIQAVGSMLVVEATPAGGAVASVPQVEAPAGAEVHVVQPGETLWGIAGGLADGGDVRATLDRLVERNGGVTSIQAGQRLLLD